MGGPLYLCHNAMERVEAVDDGDIPELGVVWSRGDLEGVPPPQDQVVTLHAEERDGLVHILGQDAGQGSTRAC